MDNNCNKNFNELLIEILKQIHVRLDRLDRKNRYRNEINRNVRWTSFRESNCPRRQQH